MTLDGCNTTRRVILVVVVLLDSDAEIARAAGVHVNLVAGLGMLVLGGFFLAWALLRPLARELGIED